MERFHFKFAMRKPPKELFHYTSAESLLAILQTQTMFATERSFLNDPEEFEFGIRSVRLQIENCEIPTPLTDQMLLALDEKLLDSLRVFVLSLSGNPDLLSQWRAYADDGKGYALGLDGAALRERAGFGEFATRHIDLENLDEQLCFCYHLLPVIYDPGEKEAVLIEFIQAVDAFWREIEDKNDARSLELFRLLFRYRVKELLIAFKQPGYKEEAEWRVVATVPEKSPKIHFRNTSFGIAPYVVIELSRTEIAGQKRLPLSSIFIGPRSPAQHNTRGLEMLLQSKRMQVPLIQSATQYRA